MPAHQLSLDQDSLPNNAVDLLQQQNHDAVDHDHDHDNQHHDYDVDDDGNNNEEEENDDDDGNEVDDVEKSKSSSSDDNGDYEDDDGDNDEVDAVEKRKSSSSDNDNNDNSGDDDEDDNDDNDEVDDDDDGEKSKSSSSNVDGGGGGVDGEEFILLRLSDLRKEVQCPICLGIIRKTRIVKECLHRFCRECIYKSMRMGNKECPACRIHCASRRSLRDDPCFDALISSIFQDIEKFEKQELAFQEDEGDRNKQIQAAIAHMFRRQMEGLSKKNRILQGNYPRSLNYRSEEEDDANGHDGGKESSSAVERYLEPKSEKPKSWRGQPSPAATGGERGGDRNDQEVKGEVGFAPTAVVGTAEMRAWGKGGMTSNTRIGSGSSDNGKHSPSRIARLSEHFRNSDKNDNEMDIQVMLVSLEQKEPFLEHSYLCVRPTLSVEQLCQFIALQTSLPPEKLEILIARGKANSLLTMEVQTLTSTEFEAFKDELEVLDSKETLAGLKATCNFAWGHLVLAYREKM